MSHYPLFKPRLRTCLIAQACAACLTSQVWAQTPQIANSGETLKLVSSDASHATPSTLLPDQNIKIELPTSVRLTQGRFAVMIGAEDVTAQFRLVDVHVLQGVFASIGLPLGASVLKVFQIDDDQKWLELGVLQIVVARAALQSNSAAQDYSKLAQAGSSVGAQGSMSNVKTGLIVGIKSQVFESHSASAPPPDRMHFIDGTLQASVQTEHGDDNASVKSAWNIVGSSRRSEAVNFGAQAANAPKVDLANFLVESKIKSDIGLTQLALGHIQAGNNPLIALGVSNRGMSISQQFGQRIDASLSLQYGSPLVGADHLMSIQDGDHRLTTMQLGAELLTRPGALRAEFTSFQGSAKPIASIGVASVLDAEQSHGWGLRFKSVSPSGETRFDLAYGISNYTPRGDSSHSIVPGPTTRAHAWSGEVAHDVLKGLVLSKESKVAQDWLLNLMLTAKHEFAGKGYKSLGATGQQGNYVFDSIGVNASVGLVTAQLQINERSDNVDHDVNFLRNKNQGSTFALTVPLAQIINKATPPLWAPILAYTSGRNHTLADQGSIPTGQTLANLPNVLALTQGLNLNWTINKLTVGLLTNRTLQDNQQVGMEQMDVFERSSTFTFGYPLTEKINFTGGLGRHNSSALDTGVHRVGQTGQAGLNGQFGYGYQFNVSANLTHDWDGATSSTSRTFQTQLQLIKQFTMHAWGQKLPGQWAFNYAMNHSQTQGITPVKSQSLGLTLSLTFL